jgi:hypothetical protein
MRKEETPQQTAEREEKFLAYLLKKEAVRMAAIKHSQTITKEMLDRRFKI